MLAILAAALLAAAPPQETAQALEARTHDVVHTADGGRAVGKVVEEGAHGVAVMLPDGTFRRFARHQVVRIDYADGSVSRPAETAPAPPPQPAPPRAYPPQRAYPPPPPAYTPPAPPPYRVRPPPRPPRTWEEPRGGGPVSPLYLSLSLGGAVFSGEAEEDVNMDRVLDSQFAFGIEGGIRLSPHLAVGLYADGGVGDPGRDVRDACNQGGRDCVASTGRFGVLLRATLQPAARTTPWLSIGTGYERSTVEVDGGTSEDLTYSGWEILRLMGGVDFRSSEVVGVGLYAGVRFGRYNRVDDADPAVHLGDARAVHTTVEGGVRFTLFP